MISLPSNTKKNIFYVHPSSKGQSRTLIVSKKSSCHRTFLFYHGLLAMSINFTILTYGFAVLQVDASPLGADASIAPID